MESIVKMGVSGKSTYGKNEQKDGPAGADQYGRMGAVAASYPAYQEESAAAAEKAAAAQEAGKVAEKKPAEVKEAEKQKVLEKKSADRRRAADEERALERRRKRHYRLIMRYVIITVVVCYILIALTGNISTVVTSVVKWLGMVGMLLKPLFWGFVLAYVLAPAVSFFEKKLQKSSIGGRQKSSIGGRKKSKRGLAVAITCVLTLLGLIILLSVMVSAVTRNLKIASLDDLVVMAQSLANSVNSLEQSIMRRLESMNISTGEVESALQQLLHKIAEFSQGLTSGLTGAVGHIGGFLTATLFAIIFCIYFLLDYKSLKKYWNRVLLAVGGPKARRNFHVLADDANSVFSGYIRGQLIDAIIMAVLISAALSLVGVKYAVIIGILSGIGNLIPYVGPVIAYGSTILVCLVTGDLRRLLIAVVVIFIIQTIDGNVINPRLLSSNIDVHPMLVIAALIVGGALGGIVGMLFAVPVAAFIKIQFDKIIDRLIEARTGPANGSSGRNKTKSGTRKKKKSRQAVKKA